MQIDEFGDDGDDEQFLREIAEIEFGSQRRDKGDESPLTAEEVQLLEVMRTNATMPPFLRFRGRRSALSVTDLVSPQWCELQFSYTLERGKKRRTKAMRDGSQIHRSLEEEIHAIVPFELKQGSREEPWGLKLLNVLLGIGELTRSGITRELPVFGYVEDILISGVIDEIVYKEPRQVVSLRPALSGDGSSIGSSKKKPKTSLRTPNHAQQSAILKFVGRDLRQLYISDAKTRVSLREPSASQVNGAKVQLMMYHHLLKELIEIDFERLLMDENLDGDAPFSDSFIAQVLSLLHQPSSDDEMALGIDQILEYNSLRGYFMLAQQQLMPLSSRISEELRIQYIHQSTRTPIFSKLFIYDKAQLQMSVGEVLDFWKGRRSPKGVDIEEAYKCRLCDFQEGCSFRLQKVKEGLDRATSAK